MTKYKLEYIWLDGYTPTPNLRGKTQIKEYDAFPTLEQLPLWGFDGSSTMQAEGSSSDCVLKPVRVFPDGARTNGVLVMCEVMMPDGTTPHPSNKRATILDDEGAWFGFEQEYFFYKDGRPLGFPESGYPAPQGPYYTGVGYKNVGSVARQIVDEHLDLCLGCRACETVCPSGVPYGQLIEAARAEIEHQRPGGQARRLFRWLNFSVLLPHRHMLAAAAAGLRFYQASGLQRLARASVLLRLLPGPLSAWEPLLPSLPASGWRRIFAISIQLRQKSFWCKQVRGCCQRSLSRYRRLRVARSPTPASKCSSTARFV